METENMTTIRRRMWAIEEQERQAVLIKWEIDNLIHGDNKPNKADVNHTHKQGEADHHALA
ncbi:hypothetical protein JF078_004663 [Salmonella enterica]|nr:hypothetical protein [Salmonella enterica]EGV1258573.1 hypothetical protein [Salmonella enterica]EHE1493263.1 hypothetical protein [Salmonella enterica]